MMSCVSPGIPVASVEECCSSDVGEAVLGGGEGIPSFFCWVSSDGFFSGMSRTTLLVMGEGMLMVMGS